MEHAYVQRRWRHGVADAVADGPAYHYPSAYGHATAAEARSDDDKAARRRDDVE